MTMRGSRSIRRIGNFESYDSPFWGISEFVLIGDFTLYRWAARLLLVSNVKIKFEMLYSFLHVITGSEAMFDFKS